MVSSSVDPKDRRQQIRHPHWNPRIAANVGELEAVHEYQMRYFEA